MDARAHSCICLYVEQLVAFILYFVYLSVNLIIITTAFVLVLWFTIQPCDLQFSRVIYRSVVCFIARIYLPHVVSWRNTVNMQHLTTRLAVRHVGSSAYIVLPKLYIGSYKYFSVKQQKKDSVCDVFPSLTCIRIKPNTCTSKRTHVGTGTFGW